MYRDMDQDILMDLYHARNASKTEPQIARRPDITNHTPIPEPHILARTLRTADSILDDR